MGLGRDDRRFLIATAVAVLATGLFAAWAGWSIGGETTKRHVSDLATLFAALAATLLCVRAGIHQRFRSLRGRTPPTSRRPARRRGAPHPVGGELDNAARICAFTLIALVLVRQAMFVFKPGPTGEGAGSRSGRAHGERRPQRHRDREEGGVTDSPRSPRMTGTPRVNWTPTEGDALAAYSLRATAARKPERIYGWIVIVLLFASTVLALFDLYLLASGTG